MKNNRKGILRSVSMAIILTSVLWTGTLQGEEIKVQAKNDGKIADITTHIIDTKVQVAASFNETIDDHSSDISEVDGFWGVEGNYHIFYSDDNYVYIDIVDKNMKIIQSIKIKKDLEYVGNVTQDRLGHYYIVYGNENPGWDKHSTDDAMVFVKYDKKGKKVDQIRLIGSDLASSTWNLDSGARTPFYSGTCELFVDSSDILVCFTSKLMYNSHQANQAVYIDTKTMERVPLAHVFAGHSFDHMGIEAENGEYIFVERNDGSKRGVYVTRTTHQRTGVRSFTTFHASNAEKYQHTYMAIGGLVELSNGYGVVAASENTLSYAFSKDLMFNEARNIFIQVFSKDFTEKNSNDPSVQLLDGVTRKAKGTYTRKGDGYLEENAVDYGVKWLTNYTGNTYASVPKAIEISDDRILIMWEKKEYTPIDEYGHSTDDDYYSYEWDFHYNWTDMPDHRSSWDISHFVGSYYMVVDQKGNTIIPETSMGMVRISEEGDISVKDGKVYWCTSNGHNQNVRIHELEVGKMKDKTPEVTRIEVKMKSKYIPDKGKLQMEIKVYPENAVNKDVVIGYDRNCFAVNEKGELHSLFTLGETTIKVVSKDNPKIYTDVIVYQLPAAPTGLKANASYTDWGHNVGLTWDISGALDYYYVYRSNSKSKGYELVGGYQGSFYGTKIEWVDYEVKPNKTYYYKVKKKGYNEEDIQPESAVVAVAVIKEPSKLQVTNKNTTSATLTWTVNKYADGYQIYYYDTAKKKYALDQTITKNTTLTYTKTKLDKGKTHYFKVRNYKKLDGKTYYSPFSDTIKIKL